MSKLPDVGENFAEFTKEGVAVVDFWASWCGPCRMLAPIIEQTAENLPAAKFGKVDVDAYPELASAFSVSSIPNVCVFKDGRLADRMIGVQSPETIENTVKKYL